MGIFASSDRTRCWTCWVQVCASTGKSRMARPIPTGSTRHDDWSINSNMSASRGETDHEAHSHTQRGQLRERVSYALESCDNSHLLRRCCSPEAEAVTRRSRADECTIAGSRAEESLTRGANRRLRYRPTRQRLQRRGDPSDARKWTTLGTAESTIMPTTVGQPSSGIIYLHARCLEGEESSSEWSWGLPDHA